MLMVMLNSSRKIRYFDTRLFENARYKHDQILVRFVIFYIFVRIRASVLIFYTLPSQDVPLCLRFMHFFWDASRGNK